MPLCTATDKINVEKERRIAHLSQRFFFILKTIKIISNFVEFISDLIQIISNFVFGLIYNQKRLILRFTDDTQ